MPVRHRHRLARLTVSIAVLVGLAGLAPAVASARPASAMASTVAGAEPDAGRTFRLDLSDGNDFVAQTNFVQCVGASIQMMRNIMGASDRTARTQQRVQVLARSLSGPTRAGFTRQGASVTGWTAALNELGNGPYRLVGAGSIQEAMRLAARSIRETGRPVGLLVWAGRHAWVMSGFEATADPSRVDGFRVTKAVVLDPLYPYGSSRWGPSPKPRQAITLGVLAKQFVPRRRGTWAGAPTGAAGQALAALAGRYVIVMPYTPIPLVRTAHLAA